MKILVTFTISLFIAGCCSTQQTTTTEREVSIVVAVPAVKDTIPATINDSIIVAENTVARVAIHFEIADSIKSDSAKNYEIKRKLERALNTINSLPVKPQAVLNVQPDSIRTTVKVTDTKTVEVEKIGVWEYIKIISVGFVICAFVILIIAILLKR